MAVLFHSASEFGRAVAIKTESVGVGNFAFARNNNHGGFGGALDRGATRFGDGLLKHSDAGKGWEEAKRWFGVGTGYIPDPDWDFPDRPYFGSGAMLGFIIGISGGYTEAFSWEENGESVPSVSDPVFGKFSIDGIAFGASCAPNANGRHGIEGVLYFYWHRRLSNDRFDSSYNYIQFKLGQTAFYRAWVIGVDFSQQDANYNIWRWSLQLAVSPKYLPRRLP